MKKKIFLLSVYFLAFSVTAVNLFYSLKGSLFSDISDLPKGELTATTRSPDGVYKIDTYTIDTCVGKGVRCELTEDGKSRNVFWQTGIDDVEVFWQDNSRIVSINGVELDVIDGGYYDCRRGTSLFQEGSLEGDETGKRNDEKK
ncbi:MAG TPA: hypothetical protein DEW35_02185 [Ruminococcaceae bacterium]|nr:hypothetical protein [Oscillospiraceae bacterium]